MSWNEILETAVEIINLQSILDKKANNPIIKEIVNRNDKYCGKVVDRLTLNNALLEHQLCITPYQISILEKINELSLHVDTQSIYTNMPESIEKASKYILDLQQKYELAIKCFDLVIDIEKLSTIEYEGPFENNEYTRKTEIKKDLFIRLLCSSSVPEYSVFEYVIEKRRGEFFASLSNEEKRNLLLQTLCLSYERNAYDYFNEQKMVKYQSKSYEESISQIMHYKMFLKCSELQMLSTMPLFKIYDEFKLIYETDLLKEKMKKKSV